HDPTVVTQDRARVGDRDDAGARGNAVARGGGDHAAARVRERGGSREADAGPAAASDGSCIADPAGTRPDTVAAAADDAALRVRNRATRPEPNPGILAIDRARV